MGAAPPQAKQLDMGEIMGAGLKYGGQSARAQMDALIEAYPKLEALQLGTVDKIGGKLDNDYTKRAAAAIGDSLAQRALMNSQGQKLATIGDSIAGMAAGTAAEGPTSIEKELYRQGETELGMGRALSPEQLRAAQQSARAALQARGMATGAAGTAAEILNRDTYGQARQDARRQFAGQANQIFVGNQAQRRDQAVAQAGLAGNLIGNASNVYGASAGLGLQGARALTETDPYQRALGPGIALGGNTLQTGSNMIGSAYRDAIGMAGNTASFNANLLDSRYNSYMNNQASLQAAGMMSGAQQNAGTMGMIGSIGSGLLSGAGALFAPATGGLSLLGAGAASGALGAATSRR